MNESPSPSLVHHVKDMMLATFDITTEDAYNRAYVLAATAEGWGGEGKLHLDWARIVKKELGKSHPWRSEDERQSFYATRDAVVQSYERLIQQNKRGRKVS